MQEQLNKYREWQRQNPEWELCCDIEDTNSLYIQWNDLSKEERMHWIGLYGVGGEEAFEEFGISICKVQEAVLCTDLKLRDVKDWPHGFCMLVFKTDNKVN